VVAVDFDVVDFDVSLGVLDFSEEDELDVSPELDPSVPDDESDLADPLVELFADSRLSVR
jgi:hypothetical protein